MNRSGDSTKKQKQFLAVGPPAGAVNPGGLGGIARSTLALMMASSGSWPPAPSHEFAEERSAPGPPAAAVRASERQQLLYWTSKDLGYEGRGEDDGKKAVTSKLLKNNPGGAKTQALSYNFSSGAKNEGERNGHLQAFTCDSQIDPHFDTRKSVPTVGGDKPTA
eukprot:CAMPEP_0170496496 /NCGR_PEP_ID=MMETSP0208-20121228/21792_1 /TAXON_ID=197538 /ORGANISM="Strombidium inclinatum, Strain S3" /LENGTH=163 /DNA_ID=CAMNT_0010773055 /DNA_START=2585 /DNA_END=3079 /DNA_ORIENTATION=-